ncbi:MAG: choice-of-anchor L domain-containing protein [Saprospiraceae bacterium]
MKRSGMTMLGLISLVLSGWTQTLQMFAGNEIPGSLQQSIQQYLLGGGVEIISIQYDGDPRAIGFFSNDQAEFQFKRGLALSSGLVDSMAQANRSDNLSTATSGLKYQADGLQTLVQQLDSSAQILFDVAKLTIRFRPASSSIAFRYFFASEEYPQFACSDFNDVFGFFLSGPRPGGGQYTMQNLALVPGTNAFVSVNTIHQGNPIKPDCMPVQGQYYHDNTAGGALAYNAYLDAFTASADVIPCAEYTMELSIADLADDRFDTGVLIEGNSFQSKPYRLADDQVSSNYIMQEGCNSAEIRLDWLDTLTPIHYQVVGTNGNSADLYVREAIRQDPAGSSIYYELIPLTDPIEEGNETVYFILNYGECGADTIRWTIIDGFDQIIHLPADTTVCAGTTMTFNGNSRASSPLQYRGSRGVVLPGKNDFVLNVPGFPSPYLLMDHLKSLCLAIERMNGSPWDIFLTSPGGVRIPLISPDEDPADWSNVCFAWDSDQPWTAAESPYNGFYRPGHQPDIIVPYGGAVAGSWYLTIINHSEENGRLLDWNLSLNDPVQETWEWYRNDAIQCTNCLQMQTDPDSSGNYQLVRSTSLRCTDVFQMHVTMVPGSMEDQDIQVINQGDSLICIWAADPAYSYQLSEDRQSWQMPNRESYRHVFNEIPLPDTFYLKISGICQDTILTIANPALQCTSGPVIRAPRDTSVNCYGHVIEEYQMDLKDGLTYWMHGMENTSGLFRKLSAGIYPVIVRDREGCGSEYVFQIYEPARLQVQGEVSHEVSCPYANDGAVKLSILGGTAPYTLAWSNGSNVADPDNLPFGPNRVVVTDRSGCVAYHTVDLATPHDLKLSLATRDLRCAGTRSGEIRVEVSGGNGPYQYEWQHNPFLDGPLAANLAAGMYRVTVTDPSGCQASSLGIIQQPDTLTAHWDSRAISCPDAGGGDLMINVNGGVQPYDLFWSNGWNQSTLPDAEPGNYCVTITDAVGCQMTTCEEVVAGRSALVQARTIQPSCLRGPRGAIEMELDPAFAPYSIIWSGGSRYMSNGYGIKNAEAGNYTAFVNDDRGCSFSRSFEIRPLDTLTYSILSNSVTCAGFQDGLFMVQIQQSNGSVFFSLDSSQWVTTGLFRDLAEGTYPLFIRDQADCTASDTVHITSPDSLLVTLGPDTTLRYGTTFELVPHISNAQGEPILVWSGNAVPDNCVDCPSLTWSPQYSGTIKLAVTDAKGCYSEDYLEIAVEDAVLIEVPTAFTPNQDGLNDRFTVHGTPPIQLLEVMVWDRLGNLIYDSGHDQLNDQTSGWDGTFLGKNVPEGTYRWLVLAETRPGKSETFSGWIQLLR